MKRMLTASVIGIILMGAGCTNPFAKKEEEKPAPQPSPPSDSASQDDEVFGRGNANPRILREGWETYRGSQGFSFQYPLSGVTTAWNGTERLKIDLPNRSLDSAWLELDIAQTSGSEEVPKLCGNVDVDLDAYGAKQFINGLFFIACDEQEGAAGSQYHTYRYETSRNGWTVRLSFTAQSMIDPRVSDACVQGTVDDVSCDAFDPSRDAKIFREIIKTFAWPQTNGISFVDEEIAEERETLILDIRYPVMTNATFADAFNERMQEDVQSLVDQFTEYSEGFLADQSPGPLSLSLEPAHIYESNGIVNVLLQGSEYTGGAHPNTVYASYIYDGENQKFLTLLEYFDREDISLEDVVTRARTSLAEQPYVGDDEDWIRRGTEPKEENYEIAKITEDGVTIIFPPYQVGPYAVGPQEVEIGL